MMSANTRKRSQAISIDGNVAERYFAVTSDAPRNTVDASISAMPLNGRSARAGARLTTVFFLGKDNAALSSLAAAAGGGFTVGISDELRIDLETKKGQMAPRDNRRNRDADMRQTWKRFVKKRVVRNIERLSSSK